jgi:hypothetical protein
MAHKKEDWAFTKGAEFANKRNKTQQEKEKYAKALAAFKRDNPEKNEQNFLEKAGSFWARKAGAGSTSKAIKKYRSKSQTGGI